ncbi:MAG: DUF1868 domain-containing protein [Anaerolineaceae bacterium]|nr:DUF1868 domain-containing protein [Anaerolineaceae bacterium]
MPPLYSQQKQKGYGHNDQSKCYPCSKVICRIPPESDAIQGILRLCEQIRHNEWHRKFEFLPPSQYALTLFDCVSANRRQQVYWTSRLPLSTSVSKVHRMLQTRWESVEMPASIMMGIDYIEVTSQIQLHLRAVDEETRRSLSVFRNQLSIAFGIRYPNHQHFRYPITLAHNLEKLTPVEQFRAQSFLFAQLDRLRGELEQIELLPPELVYFDSAA